ncbi:MAG: ATP-binding cassette domain-containing protein, partial [Romboutsia sp.]|nr:ATP-binding cassette domain-containing protein [Romboutsia sp.]
TLFNNNLLINIFDLPFTIIPLTILATLNVNITATITIAALTFYLINKLSKNSIKKNTDKYLQSYNKLYDFQIETVTKFKTIKTSNFEHIWDKRHKSFSAESKLREFKSKQLINSLRIIYNSIQNITLLIVTWIATVNLYQQNLTIGGMLSTITLSWLAITPIKNYYCILLEYYKAKNNIKNIDNLLENNKNLQSTSENLSEVNNLALEGNIKFNNVSFYYPKETTAALSNITFEIPKKSCVCIIGPNGSGKSTLLKLISKIYKPTSGMIQLDGVNIQQYDPIILRRKIAYLPQEISFFPGTIKENLLNANPLIVNTDIKTSTALVNLYKDIMSLPNKFNTKIDDQKQNLSACFKQRLALAQLFTKKSSLYLLDEPTSTLERSAEDDIIKTLNLLNKYATVVIVTHNKRLMAAADYILH